MSRTRLGNGIHMQAEVMHQDFHVQMSVCVYCDDALFL